jgi:hypothetical protein
MKWLAIFILFPFSVLSQSDYCIADRFGPTTVFEDDDIVVYTDVEYGVANHFLTDQPVSLLADVYLPNPEIDPMATRPLVVLIHGGAWLAGNKSIMAYQCQEYAKRGYVAISVGYRLGWGCTGTDALTACISCGGLGSNLRKAVYSGVQDSRAAMRYFFSTAEDYGIDTSMVFIGGESAGSINSLLAYYLDQGEADAFIPGFSATAGSLDESGNDLDTPWSIKGIINHCGGVTNTSIMDKNELVPIISFHDDADCIVPFNCGNTLSCFCSSFFGICGSNSIHTYYSLQGAPSILRPVLLSLNHCSYPAYQVVNHGSCFMKQTMCGVAVNYTDTNVYSVAVCDAMGFACEEATSCPEDLNGDWIVNTSDLLIFLSAFGSPCD